jgi:hypothetical protein
MVDMIPITGRVVFAGPPIRDFLSIGIGSELIYSFVIIACSLMIYFSTREMYELSSYKGINYFRKAFLFFGIAFFFRYFVMFLLKFVDIPRTIEFSPRIFGTATLFVFLYASSMAIFYLLYSIIWRRFNFNQKGIYVFHFLAIIISISSIFTQNVGTLLSMQFGVFLCVAVLSFVFNKDKKGVQLKLIYLLLFVFWIFNIINILIPDFLSLFKIFVYLVSLGLFLFITYKVLRTIGSK